MYRIGEFSKIAKTTIKALHYYDEIDLLKPEYVDKYTGHRFYATEQLIILHKIQALRQIGIGIEQIRAILSGDNPTPILEQRKQEIQSQIQNYEEQLSRIEFILLSEKELKDMNYQAIIKELPECIVYSKKLTVLSYNEYFQVIPAIGQKVLQHYPDLKCASPEYCFIAYLDGEYKERDINIELCEAVTELKEDFDDIKFKKIDKVNAISVMHKGPYDRLSAAYAYAFEWIENNDYIVIDNPRENYIDGIWNKENQEDWLTELQIPVVKK